MTDQNRYLELLDIIRWELKNPPEIVSDLSWDAVAQCVKNCTQCGLHQTRTQTVFGTGNQSARVMFIGEAPGAEEDRQGKPFVGRAGQLLTQMLRAVGFSRDEVFIANILKCRPPNNRDPQSAEVEKCTPFLRKQIAMIKPDVLIALGRISAHFLLDTTTSLSKLRGQVFRFNDTPLIVTYHPAYLLRTPADKSKAYEDLKKIREFL
ncbi:MAG: uracil-DNA glycosylase [Gammaproteobacteria bacterium]|nr:uracil-DNA glycosylase [Gammaproteobacteria bacterium]